MFRRRFLWASAVLVGVVGVGACAPRVPKEIVITQAQMEQGLQAHFPKEFPVAGLLQLSMQQPALRLLPVSNQLETTLVVQLSGKALKQVYQGQMQLRFGLRYAAQDFTVRTQQVQVLGLQLDGAPPALADMLQAYGLRLAAQAMEDFVLYTVPEAQQSLMTQLGVQPQALVVTDAGLKVVLQSDDQPKP